MRVVLIFCWMSVICALQAQDGKYARVKIYGDRQAIQKLDVTLDHVSQKQGEYIIGVFSDYELTQIKKSKLRYEILTDDVTKDYLIRVKDQPYNRAARENCNGTSITSPLDTITVPHDFSLGTMGGFLKYEEMLAHLDNMAAKYPNLISVRKPIHNPQAGTDFETHQDRPIYYVKISDNVNTSESSDETQILYTALHHAREPASLSQLIFYMYYLLENYGKNDWVTHLVNNREMIFVPCINPDGYIYNQTTNPNGGGMWRKNRRANSGGSFGVDLNRNYSYQWGVSGASSDPNSDTYKGPSPFSEPETQAIQSLCKQFNFKMAFNYHTHGDLLLFPYGYGSTQAPDHNRYTNLTEEMVAQNNYVNQQSVLLYAAAGDSDDYMYGNTTDKPRIFAMTPEVGDDFWIPQSAIVPVCKENLWQNISMGLQADVYPLLKTTTESLDQLTGNLNFTVEARGLNALTNAQLSVTAQTSALTILSDANIGDVNPFQVRTLTIPYTVAVGTPTGTPLVMTCTVSFNNGKTLTYPIKMIWKGTETISGQVIFEDDFTNVDQWTTTGSWGITTNSYASEPSAITDSPTCNYNNYVNMKIDTRQTIDLRGMQTAYLTFKARWNIETDDDYLQVTVVKNNVEYPVCGVYSRVNTSGRIVYDGNQNAWVTEQINLADFLGSEIKLRFRMKSDGASTSDGFYLDDVAVLATPQQDAVPPTLVSISPENNSTTSIDTDIVLTFSENIFIVANDVKLKHETDQAEIPATISAQGSIITITPVTPLQYATTYYVDIASNAITDLSGNYFAGMDNTTWTCTTEIAPDVTAPQIDQVFPAAGAMDVSENVVITATFSEAVQIVSQTIQLITETSQSVPATVSIENQTTLILVPNELLQSGTTYSVQIPANSIEDLSGNNFSGLSQSWTFTTQTITGVGGKREAVFQVSPNPARDKIFIQSTTVINDLSLSDVLGRTHKLTMIPNADGCEVLLPNFSKGIYLLRLQSNAGTRVVRIIVE